MESAVYRTRDGVLMMIDDEGNRSRFFGRGYEWLAPGESTPLDAQGGTRAFGKKERRWY